MTERLKLMLGGVAILAVGALLWMLVVSPAREDASVARDAQAAAETQADLVGSQLVLAKQAATRAPTNVRTLRRLAVAVPEKVQAAQIIDQLNTTAEKHDVRFDVLKVTNATATAAPAAAPDPATTPEAAATSANAAAPAAAPAAGVPVALNVQVEGDYVDVTSFVRSVQQSVRTRGGKLTARGRLMRINNIDLQVAERESGARKLTGTMQILAYLLPADASPTAAPAPSTTTTGTQP